jgi:hypothetical protein
MDQAAADTEAPKYDLDFWKTQITQAKKNQRQFHERGRRIDKRYRAEEQDETSDTAGDSMKARVFNLFWANVGILKAALYGNPPLPQVERVFQDQNDDISRVAAEIMRRLLSTDHQDLINFSHAVDDRLIPGMGVLWARYDADVQTLDVQGVPVQRIQDERAPLDYVHWQDLFWSPARVWEEVWWVGRRVWMTEEKFKARFPNYKSQVNYVIPKEGAVYDAGRGEASNMSLKRAEVIEIWCKHTKQVHWVCATCDEMLDEKPDPLKLANFFPCPRPLAATVSTMKFLPRADYSMVQDQYTQLDELNIRIAYLTSALKVVGVYDKTAVALDRMLNQATENQLIPVDNWAMFAEKGGIKGQVDWLPIDMIATVLKSLREMRVDVVQQIYELTGISDIMRGVTNARETFGAQKLKAQYSSSRLQLYQGQTAEFVGNAMNIKAEIIARHWQPQTILNKSQIMLTPDAQYAPQAIALIKNVFKLAYSIRVSATQMSIPDYNAEKEDRLEFLTKMGQFVGQITPLVEKIPDAGIFLLQIVQWAAAAFQTTGGVETLFDNYIKALQKKMMTPPPPRQPSAGDIKDLAGAEKAHAEAQEKVVETAALLMQLGAPPQATTMVPTGYPKPPLPPGQQLPPTQQKPMPVQVVPGSPRPQ